MAMKENSKKVLNYLKEVNGQQVTAADVAEALGLEKRSVDGIFTSAIQRKGLGSDISHRLQANTGCCGLNRQARKAKPSAFQAKRKTPRNLSPSARARPPPLQSKSSASLPAPKFRNCFRGNAQFRKD